MDGEEGKGEVASKDVAVFTREPVAIGPGESILSLGKKTAKVGRSGLSSANLLCACSGTPGAGQQGQTHWAERPQGSSRKLLSPTPGTWWQQVGPVSP